MNVRRMPSSPPVHRGTAPEDLGLVGTPYFWAGIAGAVTVWGGLMLLLWW